MKKTLLITLVASLGSLFLVGCATNELTITKCKQYKDDICVTSKIEKVKECKEPLKINGKTYCKGE